MSLPCSRQLYAYLRMRRSGTPTEAAASMAGLGVAEARLTDADELRGLLAYINTEMPLPTLQQPTEAAAVVPTIQRESVNRDRVQGALAARMDGPASPKKGGTIMPKHDSPASAPEDDFAPLIELAADTLRGDIRDHLLDWFKAQPKSWPFLSETEQRDLANAVDSFSYGLIKQATKIIAAGERPTIVAKLVEYREKDGIEAKLKLAPSGDVVAQLHEACGQEVLLVATGAEDFSGQRGDAAINADQGKLRGIGDEYGEAA